MQKTVSSYNKTGSNVLKGNIFNLKMVNNHETFHSKPYYLSSELEICLEDLVEEYLKKGYMVPIENPKITSSVFLVPKNSNEKLTAQLNETSKNPRPRMKYQMVVDIRRLNQQVMTTNSYNVRGIFANLHELQGAKGKFYACMDLKQYF